MLIFNGTTYREATPEELAEFEEAKRQEEEQKHRELSSDEALGILLGGAE